MTTHNPDHTATSRYRAPFTDYKPPERFVHCLRPGETLEEKRMSEIPKGVSVPLRERVNTKAGEVAKGPAISLPAKPPVPQIAVGNDDAPAYVEIARLVHAHGPDCSLTWLAEHMGWGGDPEGRQRVGNAMKKCKRRGWAKPAKPGYWSPDMPVDWTPGASKPGPDKAVLRPDDGAAIDVQAPKSGDMLVSPGPGKPAEWRTPAYADNVVMESKEDLARKYGIAHHSTQDSGRRPGRPVAEWSPQAKTFMHLEPAESFEKRTAKIIAAARKLTVERIQALCAYISETVAREPVPWSVVEELINRLDEGFVEMDE